MFRALKEMVDLTITLSKTAFVSFFLLHILGCESGGDETIPEFKNVYLHPEFGEVYSSDKRFKVAKKECKNKVFKRGVLYNGEKVTKHAQLISIQSAYYLSLKDNPEITPDHIVKIEIMQKEFVDCLAADMSFQLIRVDMFDPDTGNLISSTDMRGTRQTN